MLTEDQKVHESLPIVMAAARQFQRKGRRHLEIEDLRQEGLIAAMEAVRTFNPKRDCSFRVYLYRRIYYRFAQLAREDAQTWPVHRTRRLTKTENAYGVELDPAMPLACPRSNAAIAATDAKIECERLAKSSSLSSRELGILELLYVNDVTQAACAASFGITESRINQIHKCAITKLREAS